MAQTGLKIKCLNDVARSLYKTNDEQIERGDSGYDLYYCGKDITILPMVENYVGIKLKMGIACQPFTDNGYDLVCRSSIGKTPLMLVNPPGIMDIGYRGEVMASVRNLSNEPYIVKQGTALFQLVMHDRRAFPIVFTEELNDTIRGEGGFGSTNK
jgi:dUTP pyrophosphatase